MNCTPTGSLLDRILSHAREIFKWLRWLHAVDGTNGRDRLSSLKSEDLDSSSEDSADFWVKVLGPMLESMLAEGGYSVARRKELASFFGQQIAPFLGPKPGRDSKRGNLVPRWKSFVTDDFTPFEPSWTWKPGSPHPIVKFSTEAVPGDASSAVDGLAAAVKMADMLAAPHIRDSHVNFNYAAFIKVLCLLTSPAHPVDCRVTDRDHSSTGLSQVMIGFDVDYDKTHVKAYFVTTLRALATGQSKLEVITTAVRACGAVACWEHVLAYLGTESAALADPFLLAIDCVPLEHARFKVYVRFPTTNIDLLLRHISLGGRIPLSPKFVAAVRELWARLCSDEGEMYRVDSQTAGGTPIYFSVTHSKSLPTPKLYIPVRLLGWDDQRIAQTVGEWMNQYGNLWAGKNYVEALQKLSPNKKLNERYGFHTYVGVVPLANGDIETSVYLNPSVFS